MIARTYFLLLLITTFAFQGCDITLGDCGSFGSSDGHRGELRVDKPFQALHVSVGDSVDFYPGKTIEVEYTYTGNCDGSDYEADPFDINFTPRADSLVSIREYWTGGRFGLGNQRFVIQGLQAGETVIDLEAIWTFEGRDVAGTDSQFFEIPLTISP